MKTAPALLEAIDKMNNGDKAGFETGFETLYAYTHNYVFFRAKTLLSNEADAYDLLQEVYIAAYHSISNLKNPEFIYSWLGGITYNLAMKSFRKKKDIVLSEEAVGYFDNIEDEHIENQPENALEERVTGELIADLIEELPELQKSVLVAYYYDEMSIGQIAQNFECSEGTVKSRLHYARKKLEESILEKEKREGVCFHSLSVFTLCFAFHFLYGKTTVVAAKSKEVLFAVNAAIATSGISVAWGSVVSGMAVESAATTTATTAAIGTTVKVVTLSAFAKIAVTTGTIALLGIGGYAILQSQVPPKAEVTVSSSDNNAEEQIVYSQEPKETPKVAQTPAIITTENPAVIPQVSEHPTSLPSPSAEPIETAEPTLTAEPMKTEEPIVTQTPTKENSDENPFGNEAPVIEAEQ